jgi:tol-pal system protein YbgF
MKLVRPAILLASLLAVGCVTSSDLEKLQGQISDIQDQVAQLKRTASSKEEVQNVNAKIAEQTQTLLKSNATLVAKVSDIEDKMNNVTGGNEQTNYRLDRMAQQLTQAQHDVEELKAAMRAAAAAATPAPAATTSPNTQPISEMTVTGSPDTSVNPMDTYQAAYRDYQKGNYDLAMAGFREFIEKNPSSEYSDNAAYWIGESMYSQKKFAEAVQQFDSVVSRYPKSDKVPGALLKKGLAYIAIGDRARGIVQLQYVVHEHPSTSEAGLARQKLKQLGVETK